MTFGKAIKALRKGKRASRESWQVGYIYLVPANLPELCVKERVA